MDRWKEQAFKDLWNVEGLIPKTHLLNLIVVGDSEYEIDAARMFKDDIDSNRPQMVCLLKLVKFTETTSIEHLESLQAQLNKQFDAIASS